MIIANPIYDSVFKYLMEDNRIAKVIISTIIEEEISEIELRPQERTTLLGVYSIQIYRIDFAVRIKNRKGEYKNVLIEIQKAGYPADIMRFRKYLGEQYIKPDVTIGNGKERALPIITIYFLGFELNGIESQAVKNNREYIDAITKEEIEERNDFIEQLTHDSYVIQIPRLKPQRRTKLEWLLRVFDQSCKRDDRYILEIKEELPDEFLPVAQRLERAAMDKELRDKLELEEEVEKMIKQQEREHLEAIEEKDKTIEEKNKTIMEKDKAIEEKERLIEQLQRKLRGE